MLTTSRWGRNRDLHSLALQRRCVVRSVRLHGFWNYAAQHHHGAGPLRFVLLRALRRRSVRSGLGNVAAAAVVGELRWFANTGAGGSPHEASIHPLALRIFFLLSSMETVLPPPHS